MGAGGGEGGSGNENTSDDGQDSVGSKRTHIFGRQISAGGQQKHSDLDVAVARSVVQSCLGLSQKVKREAQIRIDAYVNLWED